MIFFLQFGDYQSSSERNKDILVLTLVLALLFVDVAILVYHLVRFRRAKRDNPDLRLLDCFNVGLLAC